MEIDRGRDRLGLDRLDADHALDAASRTEQVSGHGLGGADRKRFRTLSKNALDGEGLELVVVGRRGAVGVDVINLFRRDARGANRAGHGHAEPLALGIGHGDVVGVSRGRVTRDFGVNARAAFLGMREGFEDQHAGTLAHDEAVAAE